MKMGGTMSRNKGKRGEREIVDMLQPVVNRLYRACGVEPPILQRNTLQSDMGGCDIVGLQWFAPEVKRQEGGSVNAWWAQAKAQAKDGQVPVLFYRRNGEKWKVRMEARLTVCAGTAVRVVAEISVEAFLVYFETALRKDLEYRINGSEIQIGGSR